MNTNSNKKEPRFFETLGEDIRSGNFIDNLRREIRELKDFYLDEEKQTRLENMNVFKRVVFFTGWILKSMFYRLTPTRRILIIFGLVFTFNEMTFRLHEVDFQINLGSLGGIVIFFILLLELKDKLLAHDELAAGRKIQNALMPEKSPEVPGWSLWLYTRPANEVGGDLVDYLKISDKQYAVIMADVAGKGLRAALFTAKLQATVRALASEDLRPAALCRQINSIFHRDSLPNIFASLLYVELSPESGDIRFVNAGHLPPVVLKQPFEYKELAKGGPALGLSKTAVYDEHSVTLQVGDVFFAYSDGLTEACNEAGEFFGSERLATLLSRLQNFPPQTIGETIATEIARFTGNARANDDLSMIVVKRVKLE